MGIEEMMNDKVCLVTGATHGVGKETALALAHMGATVVIVSRNEDKCSAVVSEIKQKSGNNAVEALTADLSIMKEVQEVADRFKAAYPKLHVLVNNVGAGFKDRQTTSEGFEKTFALNHLSQFLLTNLLLDTVRASAPARIVNVSSHGHKGVQLNFDDLQSAKDYSSFLAYRRSKLANVIFTYELARRLTDTGVTANVLNPGVVKTDFESNLDLGLLVPIFIRLFGVNAAKGAQTSTYLASSPEVEGITGKYWQKQKAVPSSPDSYDQSSWIRLWNVTENLVNEKVYVASTT